MMSLIQMHLQKKRLKKCVERVCLNEVIGGLHAKKRQEEPEAVRETNEDDYLMGLEVLVAPVQDEAQKVDARAVELLVETHLRMINIHKK